MYSSTILRRPAKPGLFMLVLQMPVAPTALVLIRAGFTDVLWKFLRLDGLAKTDSTALERLYAPKTT